MTAAHPATAPGLLRLMFGLSAPVGRRPYLIIGVCLMALKYAFDAGLIHLTTGVFWAPWQYLSPAISTREAFTAEAPWLLPVLALTSLPFLWIGLTMSVRRAIDAGRPPALGLLFLFPGLNYLAMLYLAAQPSAPATPAPPGSPEPGSGIQAAVVGAGVGAAVGVVMAGVGGFMLGEYGTVLFLVTPVIMGAGSGWWFNRAGRRRLGETAAVGALTVLVAGGAMLLFAIEGVVCLTMAAPLAMPLAIGGAFIGRRIAAAPGGGRPIQALIVLLALPLTMGFESSLPPVEELRAVTTAAVIDAPPEAVWPHVIAFSELPPPHELVFAAGIAYPMRARIEGQGVGAVRHCEFSTGAFVEPITRWQPPHRLSFDVVAQPAPMHETSPYRHLHPPHLDGYFRSRRGEFRLTALPGGRTRLEGTTWYALDLAPMAYWTLWSDGLVHAIHRRVLDHIGREAEAGGRRPAR